MRTFTTKAIVTISQGRLGLNPAQAARCGSALAPLSDGIYKVLAPVQFKAGETFSHDMPIPKAIAHCLEEAEDAEIDASAGKPGALEDMEGEDLKALAASIGARFHPNTGKPRLIEIIKLRQDEVLAEQEQAEKDSQAKADRIAELEANPDRSEADQAELDSLLA